MRAAEKGNALSQESLGDSFAAGRGVSEDWSQAVKWWRRAADQGAEGAQAGLGLALYQGRGVQQNKEEAARWFTKAAEADEARAQAMLGRMYFLGEGGLAQSFVDAYKWLSIAHESRPELTQPFKSMVDASIRPARKKQADRLIAQWKFEKGKTKTPPAPPPNPDDEIAAVYFTTHRQLSAKCGSKNSTDSLWCDAYIAGVIDAVASGRKSMPEDMEDILICLQQKRSLKQARESVTKVMAMFDEDRTSALLNRSAANSVIAGALGLCR